MKQLFTRPLFYFVLNISKQYNINCISHYIINKTDENFFWNNRIPKFDKYFKLKSFSQKTFSSIFFLCVFNQLDFKCSQTSNKWNNQISNSEICCDKWNKTSHSQTIKTRSSSRNNTNWTIINQLYVWSQQICHISLWIKIKNSIVFKLLDLQFRIILKISGQLTSRLPFF